MTMESPHHLIDSLTSHIALYHNGSPPPNPSPTPRSPSHPPPPPRAARQSLLTSTDPSFAQILLQLRVHLASDGPTLFFLLPTSTGPAVAAGGWDTSLPSLPSPRASGLLACRQMSSHAVSYGLLLFGSRSAEVQDLVAVAEDLVADIDVFVKLMDGVSGGRFLRGEETGLGEEWKEMGWLKDRAYYSLEGFVVNRLEVALRRSWGAGAGAGAGKKGKGKGNRQTTISL